MTAEAGHGSLLGQERLSRWELEWRRSKAGGGLATLVCG